MNQSITNSAKKNWFWWNSLKNTKWSMDQFERSSILFLIYFWWYLWYHTKRKWLLNITIINPKETRIVIDQFSLTVRNKYVVIGLPIADDTIIDSCELAEMLFSFFLSFLYQYKLEKSSLITPFYWSQPRSQLFNRYILSNSLHHPKYLMPTSLKSYPRLTVPVTHRLYKCLHRENQSYRILSHFQSNWGPIIYLKHYPIFIEPYFYGFYVQVSVMSPIYKGLHSSQKGVHDQGIR